MRGFFLLGAFISGLLFTSCSSHKHLTQSQTARLSQQLGFKITKKDNLRLYTEAAAWIGTPYRYGGTTKKGVDCSGLVSQIYKQVYRKPLERSAARMAEKNCRRTTKGNLKAGDLVFFNTSKNKRGINHVGIFLKSGHFLHASTSRGVIVSHLQEDYYRKAWKYGGKVK